MKSRITLTLWIVLGLAGLVWADGFIVPVDPNLRVRGSWAVEYHHVDILVRDQVASVSIDQEFVNTGSGMIEVEYLFPVPPGAAIDSMTLIVNGQEMSARLLPADEARKIYEDIVRRKKDPALIEYVGFGLYRTKAFPLEAGKPARVAVHYDTVCKKDGDLTELWYPLNTEKFSARPIKDVKVVADLKADTDITAVYSPSHDLNVERKSPRHVVATWQEKNSLPSTDFQLYYRTANEDVGATLMTHWPEGKEDGYFMLLVSPNPRLGEGKIIPKDVVVVLDRSGSMSGEKIAQARESARFILRNLNKKDRFNVLTYSDSMDLFYESLADADRKTVEGAIDRVERITSGGGTNIHDALHTAMKLWPVAGVPDDRPKYIIFLTDGLPTVGQTNVQNIIANTTKMNLARVRLFAFGVGYDVNVNLLDKLVQENHGRSDYVKPNENIESKIASLAAKIRNPVMTALTAEFVDVPVRDQYPQEIGDLFEGDQIVALGRFNSAEAAKLSHGATTLKITGTFQGQPHTFEYRVTVQPGQRDNRFAFVERLWAIRRVGWLMDQIQLNGENPELKQEIVRLSLEYGIMTPFTSFLAEEKTDLAAAPSAMAPEVVFSRKESGADAQRMAEARQSLRFSKTLSRASGPQGGVSYYGNIDQAAYEEGKQQTADTVRQSGNQTLYRRGQLWVAVNAREIDPEKDADHQLVSDNTSDENRVLATQGEGEELLIRLRGQVYRIR
jgi:Ca-activated chloride channel family protein